MKFIKPFPVTDAVLTASSVLENDHPAWAAGTAYVLGNRVIRTQTHSIYENVMAGTDATAPENAPTRWLRIGPTNKWAAFDQVVGTRTTGTGPLTMSLVPGKRFDSLVLLDLQASSVKVDVVVGGNIIYTRTKQTMEPENQITNYLEYWLAAFRSRESVLFDGLPDYTPPTARIDITIYGATPHVGVVVVGKSFYVGRTQRGWKTEVIDYSKKEFNAQFGTAGLKEGDYRRRGAGGVLVAKANSDLAEKFAVSVRATPIVMISSTEFDFCMLYGVLQRYVPALTYPDEHLVDISFEGFV